MKYFLPYALHQSTRDENGNIAAGPDADGTIRTGRERPMFDTLIGVYNPHPFLVDARFRFFKKDGTPAPWGDGSAHFDYRLDPDQSVQMTCIPGNPFPDPPKDFLGYAIVETLKVSPFSGDPGDCVVRACFGGAGLWPFHWNEFCAEATVIKGSVPPKTVWRAPYAIKFRDANHTHYKYREKRINSSEVEEPEGRIIHRDFAYQTGLVITNFDTNTAQLRVRYKVGQAYMNAWKEQQPGHPIEFAFNAEIHPGQSLVEDLFNKLEAEEGYPAEQNSEGFVEIRSAVPVQCAPYMLISNRTYSIFAFGVTFD